jgi:hypothetical protein
MGFTFSCPVCWEKNCNCSEKEIKKYHMNITVEHCSGCEFGVNFKDGDRNLILCTNKKLNGDYEEVIG